MTTARELRTIENAGARSICKAFTREIKQDGKLTLRGDYLVDSLVAEVNRKLKALETYEAAITELNSYLNSPTFDVDTKVQVGDISLRLTKLRLAL